MINKQSTPNARIRELRKTLGLSQKSFGEQIHLSQSQMNAIETGSRAVTERVANDVCREFQVSLEWLLKGEGRMFTDYTMELDADKEAKELGRQYSRLDKRQKKVIRDMIKVLLANNEP